MNPSKKSIEPGRAVVARAVVGVAAAGLGVAGLLFGAGAAVAQERYSVPGNDVAIYNLVGEYQVVAGSGSDVTVEITRGGDDAARLTVATGVIRDRNTLRVIYPGRRILYKKHDGWWNSSLKVNDDGTFSDRVGGGHSVTITNKGDGLDARADIVIKVPAGKKVAVYGVMGAMNARDVTGDLRLDSGSSPITAVGIKGALVVDVGSGDVDVSNTTGGLVDVDTGSGTVNLTEVTADRIKVDTGSGDVRGRVIKTKSLYVDTGSGSVEMVGVDSPSVNADTGSGDVSLGLVADAADVKIDTGSGDVAVVVPPSLGARLYVEVGSGDIDVRIPMAEITKGDDSVRGRIGDGDGLIHIETGSGGVSIAGTK